MEMRGKNKSPWLFSVFYYYYEDIKVAFFLYLANFGMLLRNICLLWSLVLLA